ncbi:MAG: lipopolysaccharide biosynthesis protein [Ruminococcaceae bacterium]|nr:lipopolysaccharide biosynthesis protein [Oscillospiraceae bacterium]
MEPSSMKKNLLWNAAGNVIYLMCQWLITVLVTVLGGLEDAGVLSIAMSLSATFQTLAMFGIRNFQVSDLEGKYSDSGYLTLRAITCGGALVLCVGAALFSGYSAEQQIAILLFMLFRLAESYSDVLHGIAQKNERLDVAGKSFAMKGLGALICFLGGYLFTHSLNVSLLLMTVLSVASTCLYDLPQVRRLASFRLLGGAFECGRLALEALPLCVYLFLYTALSTLPKLILERACGGEILGAYSSIFAPALLLQIATGYLYNPFATQFAAYRRTGDRSAYRRLLTKLLVSIFGVAAVVMIAAQFLGAFALRLVYGEQIESYVYMLNPILILNFIISYFGLFAMLATVQRRFRYLIGAVAVGFAITLATSAAMIRGLGPNGASYALILALLPAIAILCVGIFIPEKHESKE